MSSNRPEDKMNHGGDAAGTSEGPDMPDHMTDPKKMYNHYTSSDNGMSRDDFHMMTQEQV
jgi:hypothetical protein